MSQRKQVARRYHELIQQSFTNHPDLPYYWPHIESVHFVGLVEDILFSHDVYVDELRDYIYDTALNMELPMGM